jgi:hypothetical protein
MVSLTGRVRKTLSYRDFGAKSVVTIDFSRSLSRSSEVVRNISLSRAAEAFM